MRPFDFTPVLFATVFVFALAAIVQFSGSWAGAVHGLAQFEKSCPIHANSH
jgi:hypothetical protein